MIEPWKLYPEIWKSEAAYLSWIRGGIRRYLWAKNPIKLEFIKENRKQIKNTNKRSQKAYPTIWGGVCEHCHEEFQLKDMEVDHKTGEHSLKSVGDIQKFVEGIVFVRKEDLALLCKTCHKIKTHSERTGLSLADAAIAKQVILICKGTAAEVKAWISQRGATPKALAKDRKMQVLRLLQQEGSK